MDRRVRYLILLILCTAGIAFAMPGDTVSAASRGRTAAGRWISQNGKTYFQKTDKTVLKGWLTWKGNRFFLDRQSGARVIGWRNIDGKRYYFRPKNGRVATGWFDVDGKRFYATSKGVVKMGWLNYQGNRYYLHKGKKGVMQTGWTKIWKKRYFFYPDGRLAVQTWLDERHFVDKRGVSRPDVVKKRKNTFRWPLDRAWRNISSPFGYRGAMPIGSSDHGGIDIPADMYTPIYAARSGSILKREYSDSSGNYIEIAHKNGLVSEYMHMTRFESGLQVGSKVKRGQVIGYVGSTGWSTGPHLHFGVRLGEKRVDPLHFVSQP